MCDGFEVLLSGLVTLSRVALAALKRALANTHRPGQKIDPEMRIGLSWHIFGPLTATSCGTNGGTGGFVTGFVLDEGGTDIRAKKIR